MRWSYIIFWVCEHCGHGQRSESGESLKCEQCGELKTS